MLYENKNNQFVIRINILYSKNLNIESVRFSTWLLVNMNIDDYECFFKLLPSWQEVDVKIISAKYVSYEAYITKLELIVWM